MDSSNTSAHSNAVTGLSDFFTSSSTTGSGVVAFSVLTTVFFSTGLDFLIGSSLTFSTVFIAGALSVDLTVLIDADVTPDIL